MRAGTLLVGFGVVLAAVGVETLEHLGHCFLRGYFGLEIVKLALTVLLSRVEFGLVPQGVKFIVVGLNGSQTDLLVREGREDAVHEYRQKSRFFLCSQNGIGLS
jgi:hypothetical protein